MLDISFYLDQVEIKQKNENQRIKCIIRKRWFILTPEEIVRQTALLHLLNLGYSPRHMTVEKTVWVNGLRRRFDILVYSPNGAPYILVECKAPSIKLNQVDLDQVNSYNYALAGTFVWLTNGHDHYMFKRSKTDTFKLIENLPSKS